MAFVTGQALFAVFPFCNFDSVIARRASLPRRLFDFAARASLDFGIGSSAGTWSLRCSEPLFSVALAIHFHSGRDVRLGRPTVAVLMATSARLKRERQSQHAPCQHRDRSRAALDRLALRQSRRRHAPRGVQCAVGGMALSMSSFGVPC